MKYLIATLAAVPRDDVRGRVTLRMADVETLAAWIREHVQDIVFGLGSIESGFSRIWNAVGFVFLPVTLPLRFDLMKGILPVLFAALGFATHTIGDQI
jgi:hypothetical protein